MRQNRRIMRALAWHAIVATVVCAACLQASAAPLSHANNWAVIVRCTPCQRWFSRLQASACCSRWCCRAYASRDGEVVRFHDCSAAARRATAMRSVLRAMIQEAAPRHPCRWMRNHHCLHATVCQQCEIQRPDLLSLIVVLTCLPPFVLFRSARRATGSTIGTWPTRCRCIAPSSSSACPTVKSS